MKIILLFLAMIIYKAISNFVSFKKCESLEHQYTQWLKEQNNDFPKSKREIINLFKKAGISDSKIPVTQPIGFGKISTFNASVFENFPNRHVDHISIVLAMFSEAEGVYRKRLTDSINPLYWIETIIYLPRAIIQYLGLNTETITTKILQVLWWILTPVAILWRDQIWAFLINLFNQLQ